MGDFSARKGSKPVEMRTRLHFMDSIVVPSVSPGEITVEVVFIDAAVQGVCTSLGYYLDLAARAPGEVRCLVRRRDLEDLNAGHGDGNNRGRRLAKARAVVSARAASGIAAETSNIGVIVAAHVV